MARPISGRSLQPTIYLCRQGPQRRESQTSIGRVRKKHTLPSHPSIQTNFWLSLQRIRIHPSIRLYTRFHMLEATWRPSHTSESHPRNSPAGCLFHTGCLQCMARLVFTQSHGVHHKHDARGLPATPGWSSSHHCGERGCAR